MRNSKEDCYIMINLRYNKLSFFIFVRFRFKFGWNFKNIIVLSYSRYKDVDRC